MLGSPSLFINSKFDWQISKPVFRYVLGTCFILLVTTLMGYNLSYLTSILALSFISPGTKPLSFKQGFGFVFSLIIINFITFIFSEYFISYPLVFMPILCLSILWLYYSDKFPLVIKLFAIISILLIPLLSMEGSGVASFVAMSLVFNTLMAVSLTQIMFWFIPWSKADEYFIKDKKSGIKQTEIQRYVYARNILFILLPIILLFFIFKLSGGVLVLIFVAILSISPALSNPKIGAVLIVANILGGLAAIVAFNLLTFVPLFIFMILLTLFVGLLFANNLFSKKKIAPIFGTAFSSFLLILGSVTSSDDEAGSAVWTRVLQISMAVIYVVVAFGLLNYFQRRKKINRI